MGLGEVLIGFAVALPIAVVLYVIVFGGYRVAYQPA